MRPLVAATLLIIPLLAPLMVVAAPVPTIVAVIDSGIEANHQEFHAGQIIAWRDLIQGLPTPYDDNGHGTATAALVAGHNLGQCSPTSPKISFAPGAPMVVAKVLTSSGSLPSAELLADALDWAVSKGATVVSISIGSSGGVTVRLDSEAFRLAVARARAAGVVVVVSAGNGSGVAGLPTPSWNRNFGNVPGVLAVGGASIAGVPVTGFDLQPDVTSWGANTCTTTLGGGYGRWTGTSFATPLVAGMIAGARDAAMATGAPMDVARLFALAKTSALNSEMHSYAQEGLGFLLAPQADTMRAHAAAGTLPDYAAQGAHARAEAEAHDAAMPILRDL